MSVSQFKTKLLFWCSCSKNSVDSGLSLVAHLQVFVWRGKKKYWQLMFGKKSQG